MSQPSIKIVYKLKPPEGIKAPEDHDAHTIHTFAVPASSKAGQQGFYEALQAAIANAKEQVGNELTAWRDAVGKSELNKEAKQGVKPEGEDEEEEEEEEEQ